jgi:transcriptional regulator with XRE-family HTH domain
MATEKQETLFAKNLKFLRIRKKKTQEILAIGLGFTRAKWTAYENGQNKSPNLEDLVKMSDYFNFSIDMLLRQDLSTFSELKLYEYEYNFEHAKGNNLRIIAITLDNQQKENIEYVPAKIKAGYMVGYNDPDFIKDLPKVSLPFISKGNTLRMFESEGDSMSPLPD